MKAHYMLLYSLVLLLLSVFSFAVPVIQNTPTSPWPSEFYGIATLIWVLAIVINLFNKRNDLSKYSSLLNIVYCLGMSVVLYLELLNIQSIINNTSSFATSYHCLLSFFDATGFLAIGLLCFLATKNRNRRHSTSVFLKASIWLFSTMIIVSFFNLWIPALMLTSVTQFENNLWLAQAITAFALLVVWKLDKPEKTEVFAYKLIVVVLLAQCAGILLIGEGSVWVLVVTEIAQLSDSTFQIIAIVLASLPIIMGRFVRS